MTHKFKFKQYYIISCLFHCIGFWIVAWCMLYRDTVIPSSVVKSHKAFEISFVAVTKSVKKSVDTQAQKTIQKTIQKTVQKNKPQPLLKIVQKKIQPKLNPNKNIVNVKRIPLNNKNSPVKRVPFNEQPLSQKKSLAYNTDANTNKKITPEGKNTKHNNNIARPPIHINQNTDSFSKTDYIAYVKQRIAAHKFYPNTAKRRAIEGRVGIQISIKPTGHILSLHIISSSGSDILDKAAIQSVQEASPFKKPPKHISFSFGMNYYLQ